MPKAKTGELALEHIWYPIQVKQKDKAGRPDIGAFEAMMAREDCAKGLPRLSPAAVSPPARLFVSFDYSSDALTEISRFFKQTRRFIVPLTVQEIAHLHPGCLASLGSG